MEVLLGVIEVGVLVHALQAVELLVDRGVVSEPQELSCDRQRGISARFDLQHFWQKKHLGW